MEGRRRHKWDSYRRSQNRRPPRGNCSWQPTVPWWEKEFCRVIGSLDWETLLQMKKYTHLYENVLNWNDSAGEEAFSNAKKRFWAEINGLPCDISLPDPDLCIDKIDWDSEIDPDLESEPPNSSNPDEDHEPVVTFGDSLFPGQAYSVTGWGDEDENFRAPTNEFSGDQAVQNWCGSFENGVAVGWPSCYNDSWHGNQGWGGGWNDWGWGYSGDNVVYGAQPEIDRAVGDREQGRWNDTQMTRDDANGRQKGRNSRGWDSVNGHHGAIAVGQSWNR